ncbi:pyridoxal phosphate-dependent aminotransferase [Microlunatus ginsengisoli]|uniref:Pyridoxal phosphate-dependent aminotransferase n=1 Tax=Microlunatus ginsengisoli TaxID=363863 RepID=A0ABP7A555_9ACTN
MAVSTGSVNLGQGFPDTDGPAFMLAAAEQAIANGVNQYPPGRGIAPLRQAIADHSARHYGLGYDPDAEVLVTTGATEALASAILAFVDPGDEVIALEPFYDSYAASIDLAGGTRVGVGLFGPDFRLDLDEFAAAFTPRTKLVLINSPHNPTGTVLDRAELAEIARLAVEHDVLVVCDEVYEHLVFDDARHVPLATFPGMRERTVRISSSGKTYSATGWKIGWALGTPELISEVTAVKQFLTYVSGAPFQPAIARALNEGDDWVAALRADLQRKRDRLAAGLRGIGLEPAMPRGTYFMTTDVRPLGYADGIEFCRDLPTRCGVVAIPHQVFYDDIEAGRPYVRWAFCKRDEVLDTAIERLNRGLGRTSG